MMPQFARRLEQVRPSAVREILKVTAQPEVISFAGGLPAPELFPVDDIRLACERVLRDTGSEALQYGQTEGYSGLRDYLTAEMTRRGVACPEAPLVTTGSQQALDLIARVFLNPGDVVLTERPTYLAAVQLFQMYQARFVSVPTDDGGLIPEALPELIAAHRPKLLYVIPNFQNPTGITLSAQRRQRLYEVAAEHRLLVVEDDPYGRLRYTGHDIAPLKAVGPDPHLIYLSTFSKTVAPGMRVGWVAAAPEILRKLVMVKQAADLHSSILDQHIVCHYLRHSNNDAHVDRIRNAYGERYHLMDERLKAEMPAGFDWTHPEGGMFLWVRCPEHLDTGELLKASLRHKVAFVPGQDFFPDQSSHHFMRLNFSNSTPERIVEGIARLAALCREATA